MSCATGAVVTAHGPAPGMDGVVPIAYQRDRWPQNLPDATDHALRETRTGRGWKMGPMASSPPIVLFGAAIGWNIRVMTDYHRFEVLDGLSGQGYHWQVDAGGTEGDFMTMMYLFEGDRLLHSGGMGGPKLYSGCVIPASPASFRDGEGCHAVVDGKYKRLGSNAERTTDCGARGPARTRTDGDQDLKNLLAHTFRGVVLDAGRGTGTICVTLAALGLQSILLDLSAEMMTATGRLDVPRVQADVEHIPMRSASVDGVHAAYALQNVANWRAAVGEVARVVRLGGPILVAWGNGHLDDVVSAVQGTYFAALRGGAGVAAESSGLHSIAQADRAFDVHHCQSKTSVW